MENKIYNVFYNDTFEILLILKESEMKVGDETCSLLLYDDIANKLGIARQTVAKHMKILEENGYIEVVKRGRTKITNLGNSAIKKLK